IECCPSSNVQTGAVADMATHPFKFYLDFGIRVTINTDNRLITETTVTKELSVVSRQFGLNAADIRNILVAGFKSAFLTFHGRYRIIDFVLSNFANSGVLRMKVLTQYKSESLNTHISRGWRLSSMLGQFVESVPAQQRTGPEWYKGSADAIYQNLNLVTDEEP